MSTEAHRILMEQFGDLNIPGAEPQNVPQQQATRQQPPVSAQEKIMQDMADVVMTDLSTEALANITKIEVVDAQGRSYTVNLNKEEAVSYSFEDHNETLRISIG